MFRNVGPEIVPWRSNKQLHGRKGVGECLREQVKKPRVVRENMSRLLDSVSKKNRLKIKREK